MGRLSIATQAKADAGINSFVEEFERRVQAMPPGTCPIAVQLSLLQAAEAQTCGKCTPCSHGIPRMEKLIKRVLNYEADESVIKELRAAATLLRDTADCAVGYDAGSQILTGLDLFAEEYASHINDHVCAQGTKQTVPCVTLCPAHVNIPAYIGLVREGDCAGAIKMIRKDNPFPTACAMVCEHPCEARCRRTIIDAPLNIRGIKKYAVDTIPADKVPVPERAASTGKKVAIVGGGPSGLTCAYFLSLMGHDVEVFEMHKSLGGMMRYGIPAYRFPRDRIDEDIRAILSVGGIEAHLNHKVDDAEMRQLSQDFDAVYVAVGAQGGKTLDIEGVNSEGVMSAVSLLERIGDGDYPDFSGKNVVVIGGGNVAMDCARTSVRAGAQNVTVVYRRRLEDMTALEEEVHAALAEGVEMVSLQAPVRIESNEAGAVTGLVCQPQRIGPVKNGRPAPLAASKPEVVVKADIILIAVGQEIQSAPFEEFGMKAQRTRFVADEFLQADGFDNIYVGGDCQTGPKTVIMAIAAGKVAARNIDDLLGFNHELDCGAEVPPARPNDRTPYGRVAVPERPVRYRRCDNKHVELPMTDEEAAQESSRCLRCDVYGIGALTGRELEQW